MLKPFASSLIVITYMINFNGTIYILFLLFQPIFVSVLLYFLNYLFFILFYFLFWLTACVQSLFRHVWLFATPWTVAGQALLSWDSPDKNTETGCHAILQWNFYYYCFVILGVSSEGHIYVRILMPYTREIICIYTYIWKNVYKNIK